jgi:large subunit ribosomal protein L5
VVPTLTNAAAAPTRVEESYKEQVFPAMRREFSYENPMQVPRLQKIVLNIGLGEARENARALDTASADIATITGQKPVITRSKKSIANFRLREGMPIGVMVTLRGRRMYEFFDRLVNAALPRIRDFRGLPTKAFDGRGNYSLGVREQLIFPEIDYDKVDRIRGMQINICTSAGNDEEGKRLLELMGMPFAKGTQ